MVGAAVFTVEPDTLTWITVPTEMKVSPPTAMLLKVYAPVVGHIAKTSLRLPVFNDTDVMSCGWPLVR